MAITTSAVCNVFKTDVLKGVHNFTAAPTGNTFKLSMYTSSATLVNQQHLLHLTIKYLHHLVTQVVVKL